LNIIKGKSGRHYYVDEIKRSWEGVVTVVKVFTETVDEQDIIAFQAMLMDLDVSGEVKAPSFTDEARRLAARFEITLTEVSLTFKYAPAPPLDVMAVLRWLGHAAWQIELDGKVILIDPFLSQNPAAAVKPEDIEKVDYVIVSHEHFDHLGDAFEICKRTGALFIAMYELKVKADENGVQRTFGANIGGPFTADGLKVTLTPALHSGNPAGIVIHGEEATIYHAGDTGLFSDMKLIGQLYKPDIALIPIGSLFTMGPEEAAVAVSLIKPKVAIPMHYNTFDLIKQDPQSFAKLVKRRAKGVKVVILNPGETYEYKKAGRRK